MLRCMLGQAFSIGGTSAAARIGITPSTFAIDYNTAISNVSVRTFSQAQATLDAVDNALRQINDVRASLGAITNRLENTVSNLTTQAENLQAAESRISDVDVATEMTKFVRNQILTQSSVAMLSQANSMPKMAMQLIGG